MAVKRNQHVTIRSSHSNHQLAPRVGANFPFSSSEIENFFWLHLMAPDVRNQTINFFHTSG